MGIELAGGNGSGTPEISTILVCFNGIEHCGHEKRKLHITWPAKGAKGVDPRAGELSKTVVDKPWFAGAMLLTRTCGGDCSHETFYFPQRDPKSDANGFNFCKTAYKPYDLAVNAFLIIAKHYLKDALKVHSDGEGVDWEDGRRVCEIVLRYGKDFELDHEKGGD